MNNQFEKEKMVETFSQQKNNFLSVSIVLVFIVGQIIL